MKVLKFYLTFFIFTFLLLFISACPDNENGCKIVDGSGIPDIDYIYVPPFGSFGNLRGHVAHVNNCDYKVAVYIFVASGWWTKPYWDNPLTTINNDGSWECDITTGGIDEQATKITAFLVPNSYNPVKMDGGSNLPSELFENSVSNIEVTRTQDSTFRTLSFSGYEWTVKTSENPVGPGPNLFLNSTENIWIDNQKQLHLKVTTKNGQWYCAEVISKENFGYGNYIFYLSSRIDQMNENAVLGLFTWSDDPDYHHREIDIEFSRWSNPNNLNSQYVVQPWENPLNIYRFNTELTEINSTHIFIWQKDSIKFISINGHFANPPDSSYIINDWTYKGQDIPVPGNENARINLWLFNGDRPSDNKEVEVVINKFEFIK